VEEGRKVGVAQVTELFVGTGGHAASQRDPGRRIPRRVRTVLGGFAIRCQRVDGSLIRWRFADVLPASLTWTSFDINEAASVAGC